MGKNFNTSDCIYMDYAATTPVDPAVVDSMLPYFTEKFGNMNSQHIFGWIAEKAVEDSRNTISSFIGASSSDEIVFTSGATESNNLAIKGLARFHKDSGKNHIISVCTEHKCVLNSCKDLIKDGFEIEFLKVDQDGLIDLDLLRSTIKDSTLLVSVMTVNNETGVVQPLREIGKICQEKNVFFHSDAAQAIGKVKIDVEDMGIDMLSISSHKIYGPKGCGALYVRKKGKRVKLLPIISGGGQERGMRSGTEAVAFIVGFGRAIEIAEERFDQDREKISALSDLFMKKIQNELPKVEMNGSSKSKIKNILNLSFDGIEGESMMMSARKIAFSSGSACNSHALEPSHVIRSMFGNSYRAHTSLRFSFGRFLSEDDIIKASENIIICARKLRSISPVWEER